MTSLYECSLFSQDVYEDKMKPLSLDLIEWKRSHESRSNHLGFFARTYMSKSLRYSVIAFRGTILSSIPNLYADAKISLHSIPEFLYNAAWDYYFEACEALKLYAPPHTLPILTGHSLGGVLAKLLGANLGVTVVAFNSPGIGGFREIEKSKNYKNIININSRFDKMPTYNLPFIGQRYVLDSGYSFLCGDEIKLLPAYQFLHLDKVDFLLQGFCLYDQHSIDNITEAIKGNNTLKHKVV